MKKRSSRGRTGASKGPTPPVSYRLKPAEHEKLAALASAAGMSEGGFARQAMLERLAAARAEATGAAAVHDEVRTLRRELALATRAILTVVGNPVTPEQAAEWVRKNLNR